MVRQLKVLGEPFAPERAGLPVRFQQINIKFLSPM
jgi:hypothetical protein